MEGRYVAKVKPQTESYLLNFLYMWGVEVFFPRILQPARIRLRDSPCLSRRIGSSRTVNSDGIRVCLAGG